MEESLAFPHTGAIPRASPGGTGRGDSTGNCDATALSAPPDAELKRGLPPQQATASIIPNGGRHWLQPIASSLVSRPAARSANPRQKGRRAGGRRGDNAARDTGRGTRGSNVWGGGRGVPARARSRQREEKMAPSLSAQHSPTFPSRLCAVAGGLAAELFHVGCGGGEGRVRDA